MPYYQIVDLFGTQGHGVGNSSGSQSSVPNPFNPSGSGTNPIFGVVSPLLQTVDDRNLAELKKLGKTANIKATFTNSKNQALKNYPRLSEEMGYSYKDRESPEPLQLTDNGDGFQIIIRTGPGIYGNSHVHPDVSNGGVPMFSLSDVFSIGIMKSHYRDPQVDNSKFFFSLTARFGEEAHTFVIKINNWYQFAPKASEYYNMSQAEITLKDNQLNESYRKQSNRIGTSPSDYLSTLMAYLNDNGISGLDIYMSPTSSMSDWTKFVYNPTTRKAIGIEQ